jgi:coenzyme Q-binding protein COQ10
VTHSDCASYSQKQLYAIVADIPSYSHFIPFCQSSSVLGKPSFKPDGEAFDVDAELKVGFGGLEERYTSKVVGRPYKVVTVSGVSYRIDID